MNSGERESLLRYVWCDARMMGTYVFALRTFSVSPFSKDRALRTLMNDVCGFYRSSTLGFFIFRASKRVFVGRTVCTVEH